jgi:hypothetical protein
VRQVRCVGIGVFIETTGVVLMRGVDVGGKGVGERTGCSDGEQAEMNASNVKSIIIRFIA